MYVTLHHDILKWCVGVECFGVCNYNLRYAEV